jgi:hypothetical protein
MSWSLGAHETSDLEIRSDSIKPSQNQPGRAVRLRARAVRLPAPGYTGLVQIGRQHMPAYFGELQRSKNIQMTETLN